MAYQWSDEPLASFRLPVSTNIDGDIAGDGDTVTGTRTVTFGYVDNAAALTVLVEGNAISPYEIKGLGGVFIEYLFGGEYVISGAKKSVTYSAEEVA